MKFRALCARSAVCFSLAVVPPAMVVAATPPVDLSTQLEAAKEDGTIWSQIEILRRMVEADPAPVGPRADLLRLWLEAGDFEMASGVLDSSPDLPAEVRAVARARILANEDRAAEARSELEAYLKTDPRSLPAALELVGLLSAARDYAAIEAFLRTSPLTDSSPALLLAQASALRAGGNFSDALKVFARAREAAPEDADIKREAPSFERLAKAEGALLRATRAIQKNPGDYSALTGRSFWRNFAGLRGAHDDAVAALKILPGGRAGILMAARTDTLPQWELRSKYNVIPNAPEIPAEALQSLAALDLAVAGSTRPSAPAERARFLIDQCGQFLLAKEDAQTAVKTSPKSKEAWFELVRAASGSDDFPPALAALSALDSLKAPKDLRAAALLWISAAQFRAGNLSGALELADQSIRLKPFTETYRLRSAIHQRLGNPQAAAADLSKAGQ